MQHGIRFTKGTPLPETNIAETMASQNESMLTTMNFQGLWYVSSRDIAEASILTDDCLLEENNTSETMNMMKSIKMYFGSFSFRGLALANHKLFVDVHHLFWDHLNPEKWQ